MDDRRFWDRSERCKLKPVDVPVKERTSAYGLAVKGGKVLLVRPSWKEVLDLPGGGVEEGEDVFAALRREFKEETGWLVRIKEKRPFARLRMQFYADDLDQYFHSDILVFLVELLREVRDAPLTDGEIRERVWVDLDRLDDYAISNHYVDVLRRLRK